MARILETRRRAKTRRNAASDPGKMNAAVSTADPAAGLARAIVLEVVTIVTVPCAKFSLPFGF
jgi:hypothetical protein